MPTGFREWLFEKGGMGTVISLVALSVSAISAYYTFLRVNLDLSVVATDTMLWAGSAKGGISSFEQEAELSFINNGNRPVAILDITYWLFEIDEKERQRTNCDFGRNDQRGSAAADPPDPKVEPFVVKAGEIIIFKPKFANTLQPDPALRLVREGDDPRLVLTARRSKNRLTMLGCLDVKFTAPGIGVQEVERPIYSSEIDITREGNVTEQGRPSVFGERPIPLIRRTM